MRAVACVQDFVRHPLFTQRYFFSETGVSILNAAVTAADAVQNSAKFDPWGAIGVEAGPVIADLKSCREKIVSRRKAVRDTRERWFSAEIVASSAVGLFAVLHLRLLSRRVLRSRGGGGGTSSRDRSNAPVFQGGYQ